MRGAETRTRGPDSQAGWRVPGDLALMARGLLGEVSTEGNRFGRPALIGTSLVHPANGFSYLQTHLSLSQARQGCLPDVSQAILGCWRG